MNKFIFSILLIFLSLANGYSQSNARIWYFGKSAGIDFNETPPKALTDGALQQNEGCATLCDPEGNIVIYTDGMTLYNKNHSPVENGTGLLGAPSSTQSGLIVPLPNNDSIAIVFSVDAEVSQTGITYSIVDLKANHGLCRITEKNIHLAAPSEEKITAVHHKNGKDIWVITHIWNSSDFHCYLITEDGLNTTPYISTVSPYHSGNETHGYLKVSSTGDKLAIVTRFNSSIVLYDFDNESGAVSNPIEFPHLGLCYGLEFSPDGTKLYVTKYNNGSDIYQYDLSSGNPDDIFESKYTVATVYTNYVGAAQLAPDGKIYITRFDFLSGVRYLSVIENPNIAGIECNYKFEGFDLQSGRAVWGLPTFVQSAIIDDCRNDFDFDGKCTNEPFLFFSNHFGSIPDSVRWDFGDPESGSHNHSTLLSCQHVYTEPGEYSVSLTSFMNKKSCTVSKNITVLGSPDYNLPDTIIICDNESVTIQIPDEFTCFWSDESNDNTRIFNEEGSFWVEIQNDEGCSVIDSMDIFTAPSPQFSIGNDTIICQNEYLALSVQGFTDYLWQDGSTDPVYIARERGIYWLEIRNQFGCRNRDSLRLTISQPEILLPPDTMICDNDSILLIAGSSLFDFEWFDGSIDTAIWAYIQGTYSVTATDSLGCTATKETIINHIDLPVVELGQDTGFCDYDTLSYAFDTPYTTYIWNDTDTAQRFIPASGGTYWVNAYNRCGEAADTITLEEYLSPEVYLGPDTLLFPGEEIFLDAGAGYLSYLWNNSATAPSINVGEPGEYFVTVWNEHCMATDSVKVKAVPPFYVPNVFTPNNDGYNDDFEILGEYLSKFQLFVVNRWGETLFETNNINDRWDGTFMGRPCHEGVYFWIIRYQYPNESTPTTIQGTVTIIID